MTHSDGSQKPELPVHVSTFDTFVRDTDRTVGKSDDERIEVAIYGLNAEVGSVVAAIKKRLLSDGSAEVWDEPNEEIIEELGDVMWYCFSLAGIANAKRPVNIFVHDIANLKLEISAANERAERLQRVLDPSNREEFLRKAAKFPRKTRGMVFEDYQSVAILTARTTDRTLVEVCLAVLWQLGGELFRRMLPRVELELNRSLPDRPINDILGEIAWHVSALAHTYGLALSDIARRNMEKVSFRLDRRNPTPLHDDHCHPSEQFPRQFEISFVTVAAGRSRMYLDGKRLGDDLTDNAYNDDGYRYHDVMHLANVAKLSWSPVLRGLMGRKRKRDARIDEVEDGARAKIVEEAVIKAIHSEGVRTAMLWGPPRPNTAPRLFSKSSEITFRFLKFVRNFVVDLEVHKNRYWEWEEAILAGHDIFHRLRSEGQGTVVVDLVNRSIDFKPEVCVNLVGRVAGLGSAHVDSAALSDARFVASLATDNHGRHICDELAVRNWVQRLAILDALGIKQPSEGDLEALQVHEVDGKGVGVKAKGSAQRAMWDRRVVGFRTTISISTTGACNCTAIAVADD
jgi:NTP pyrophosphatase (non-canonical NTP hydrolase)